MSRVWRTVRAPACGHARCLRGSKAQCPLKPRYKTAPGARVALTRGRVAMTPSLQLSLRQGRRRTTRSCAVVGAAGEFISIARSGSVSGSNACPRCRERALWPWSAAARSWRIKTTMGHAAVELLIALYDTHRGNFAREGMMPKLLCVSSCLNRVIALPVYRAIRLGVPPREERGVRL